ncbi:hypothetical protein VNO78_35213 [Psophocarpus tetragonolobus]|uniref:Uncharacterized protein n=1 Tax=Psophocarpus tetragonolobus TaxID=3891 RepID=A0AAN9NS46_PSOTE
MESFAMRWKSPLPPTYGASLLECGLWVQRTPGASQKNRSIFLSLPVEHFVPSCSSIGNQDKPGTTVRRENTRSHSDLDMWNRLAPYVLKLFGRHGKSSEEKKDKVLLAQVQIERAIEKALLSDGFFDLRRNIDYIFYIAYII